MKTLSVKELQSRTSQCVRAIEAGENIVLTKYGNAIARIIPYTKEERIKDIFKRFNKQKIKLKGMTIKGMIEEGRQ